MGAGPCPSHRRDPQHPLLPTGCFLPESSRRAALPTQHHYRGSLWGFGGSVGQVTPRVLPEEQQPEQQRGKRELETRGVFKRMRQYLCGEGGRIGGSAGGQRWKSPSESSLTTSILPFGATWIQFTDFFPKRRRKNLSTSCLKSRFPPVLAENHECPRMPTNATSTRRCHQGRVTRDRHRGVRAAGGSREDSPPLSS